MLTVCSASNMLLVPVPHARAALRHAGRLQSLQGVCVPVLRACGYWEYRLTFVLATTVIDGRHPEPGEAESPEVLANAQQVGAAAQQPCLQVIRGVKKESADLLRGG